MNAFQMALEDCRLNDLGFVGRWFTWERGKFLDTNIREHLDREFRRQILELNDRNGRRTSSNKEILKLASDYFSNLFSASEMGSDEHVFGLVEKRVTESMNDIILKQFTEEDTGSAVKMMAPLKVTGVDGFSAIFFKDDCILFGDASCEGARVVRDVIREYEIISGQRVNFDKSLIYFGDLLSAKNRSYPTFTWKSICSSQELIAEGLVLRVGSGARINIWNDSWLLGRENNRISVQKIMPS
ncbi:hypothetical protein J1N35_036962 [Gossypium stocksii]|uniref:Reverse transcriptase n=1 Tax=Gossypium stocksii TaxID=47602 RepID=A0A9D3UJ82_9ROSI|nr:hypothetical protein J1N35_036962 [Gossypium stocksii]